MAGYYDYDTNVWYDLRDVRGPQRTIMAVDNSGPGATLVTNSCGHVAPCNQIFHYKVGSQHPCHDCLLTTDNVLRQESR